MANEQVEQLFQQVLQKTEALQVVLGQSAQSEKVGADVDSLLNEREALLIGLRELLQRESKPEQYRVYYEQCRHVEATVTEKLASLMGDLSHKMKEAKQNKQVNKQYDAYLRLMPYGAFIDDKK